MSNPLWLVDRSRIVDGRGWCQRARYLGYHSGPNGYGIALKGTKLPLMTGIGSHDGLAQILAWCRDHAEAVQAGLQTDVLQPGEAYLAVPTIVVREAIHAAQQAYWTTVEARGFAYLEDSEDVQQVVREQQYLIEGLIWVWCLEVLPEILRRGRIVEVEHDDTFVCGCTCGLGDGVLAKTDHEARDCGGIGLMCRPDFLVETWDTKELEYHEFKTLSMDSPMWRDKWETMVQLFAATLDAERRLEKHVQSIYIHGLIKGRREGDYNAETGKRDGMIRQNSPFCYGYRKPATPPMERESWEASYEYFDQVEQKTKRLGRAYKKTGVWELAEPEGMSRAEYWVKAMPGEVRRKQLILLGPFSRQQQQVHGFLQEMVGEEQRWQAGLWRLYETAEAIQEEAPTAWPDVWSHLDFQSALNSLFPRSYECRRYGMRNKCSFEDICFGREGWADPLGSGRYVERRPHHADELQQAIDRGLLLPEVGIAEELEVEG